MVVAKKSNRPQADDISERIDPVEGPLPPNCRRREEACLVPIPELSRRQTGEAADLLSGERNDFGHAAGALADSWTNRASPPNDCRPTSDARSQDSPVTLHLGQSAQNWHQTGTEDLQKDAGLAGIHRLTLVILGSPTWARTRDLRINSPALYQLSYRGTTSNYRDRPPRRQRLRSRPAARRERFSAQAGTSTHG